MKQLFNQIFLLKKSKNKKSSLATVYLRLTVDGKRTELSTGRQCETEKWSSKAGRLSGKTEEVKAFNNYLDTIEHRIYEIHRELIASGTLINGELIKNKYLGVSEHRHSLIEVYEYHNLQFEALVGKEFAIGTLYKFKTSLAALKEFIPWKFGKADVTLSELNYQFVTDYEFFLKSERGLQHNTAMGIIKKLKKIARICLANEWIDKDPFIGFKIKTHDTQRAFLTEKELESLIQKELTIDRLRTVRDIFVFSCFTGLAYSDIAKLSSESVVTGVDGGKWISISRTKTNEPSRIPLLYNALAILQQYADHPKANYSGKLLPVLSNQRMNGYLKELADLCGIAKELTFHCARHTFATSVTLTNGVPLESVSKMLGHRSLRTTQIYAKVLDLKISNDMRALKKKYARKSTML